MKKIFTFVVLAVAAIAMVSCNKNAKLVEEINNATKNKDITRLVAIADSLKGAADATAEAKAYGVCAYANAIRLMAVADAKGAEDYKKDPSKAIALEENVIALYEAANSKDADAAKKVYAATKEQGGEDIEAFIPQVKTDMENAKKVLAEPAAAPAAEGDQAAELEKAANQLEEAANELQEAADAQ